MSSSSDTRGLIQQGVEHLIEELPALKPLRLVIRLELKARGDAPVWRVELPGPKITKDPAADSRIDVSVIRSNFNDLARDGTLKQLFREEIKKSFEEYIAQVGQQLAESTTYFQEALNEVLGAGKKIF